MRKILLLFALVLSAVGFQTHATDVTTLLSESIDDGTICILKNQRRGKFVGVPATGNPIQTNSHDENITWLFLKAQSDENLADGITPVYIYNIGTKKYMHHGADSQSTPTMSEAEAQASADGLWYLVTDGDIVRISTTAPTLDGSSWTYSNNKCLLDDQAGTSLTKWNNTIDTGNGFLIAQYDAEQPTIGKVLAEVTDSETKDVIFQLGRTYCGNFYLDAVEETDSEGNTVYSLYATKNIDNNTIWTIEKAPTDGEYYIKNKKLSADGTPYYLGRCDDWSAPAEGSLFNYQGKRIIFSQTPVPYKIEYYTGGEEQSYGNIITGLTCSLRPADGNANSGFNPSGGLQLEKVPIKGYNLTDGGDAWNILTNVDEAERIAFENQCERYRNLVNYLNGTARSGLLKDGVAQTTLNAIDAAVTKAENDLDGAQEDLETAIVTLYKGINPINVLLKSKTNKYLANHMSLEPNEEGKYNPQPHAHSRFGFASVWQLSYQDGSEGATEDDQQKLEGLHIQSFYRKDDSGKVDGLGNAGASFSDHGFYLSYVKLNNREGVVFINNDDKYLSDHSDDNNDPQTRVEDEATAATLWDIIPVALPKTISVTPESMIMTIGDEAKAVGPTFTFVSDITGQNVPAELQGVEWSIEDENIATIEAIDPLEYYENVMDEDGNEVIGYNGYANAKITPKAPGTTKITAKSVMSESLVTMTDGVATVPSCEITLVVKKVPLTAIEASHVDATIAADAEGEDRNIEVSVKATPSDYDLSAGTLSAVLTQEGSEETIDVEIAPKTSSAEGQTLALMAEDDEAEEPAPAVYVATVPATAKPGIYNLKVTYNEGTGDDAIEPKEHTATATITVAEPELKSLTASIPADTKISADATEATVQLTVVPTPASFVIEYSQLTVTIGEGDAAKNCIIAAATGDDAEANTFTVTLPEGLEAGEQTLAVSFKADESAEAIPATVTESGTLTFTVTAQAIYTLSVSDGETTITDAIEITSGESATITVTFTDADDQTVTAQGWTATIKSSEEGAEAQPLEVTDNTSFELKDLADGTYTLTIAAPADGEFTFTTRTITVTVAPAPEAITGIAITTSEADLAAEVAAEATTATVAIAGKVIPAGATIPEDAKVTFTAACDTEGVSATIAEATIASDGTFTTTANVTVPETLTEAATISVTATYTDGITATFAITVTKATAPVAEPATITGISDLSAKTAAVKEGETSAEAEISGKVTLDPEDGAVPTDAALTLAAATTAEGVESVEISDVKIAADGTFTATATVTLADGTTIPEEGIEAEVTVTPTVGEGDDAQTLDPATVTITISNATEGSSEDLEVKQPEESEIPAGAVVEVNAESKTAEVGFNASPAEGEAVASIKLPTADEAVTFENPEEMFTIDYSAEGVATATIDEKGNVTISLTDGAAIGSATVISIYAAEPKADAPATQTAIMLADETDEPGEADETEDAPAAILTINVTVYGVEFTTAPATATLGANGSVEVTFATNAKVPGAAADSGETEEGSEADNAAEVTLECEGAEVNGNVITFTEAGSYTVTAKAGDNYVATTTITVKNAPTVTGIEAVNADAAAGTAAIYDLQGRRLTRVNAAGIYIVNGVKTLVR